DETEELIVVPIAVRHTASKVKLRNSSTNSKAEEFLTGLQNLKTQENEAYSTGILEDTLEILAFKRELDELTLKHLREYVAEERTMTVDDLLQLVPKLITKVDSLETELKQTKLTIGKELVKLVKKVKKREDVLKRRHVVLPDSEDEDAEISSKQGRNLQEEGLDEMVRNMVKDKSEVASQRSKSVDKGKRYKRRKESREKTLILALNISTGFKDISTGFEDISTGFKGKSRIGSFLSLKKLKFEEIKEEFEKLVKQIDTFVPINIEAIKAQLKRYGEELQT
ncbi:hypothetical protein Tco_0929632, partial [Tanacetum coccineum]